MSPHITLHFKPSKTDGTLIGSLSSMYSKMIIEVPATTEGFTTIMTRQAARSSIRTRVVARVKWLVSAQ